MRSVCNVSRRLGKRWEVGMKGSGFVTEPVRCRREEDVRGSRTSDGHQASPVVAPAWVGEESPDSEQDEEKKEFMEARKGLTSYRSGRANPEHMVLSVFIAQGCRREERS